MESTLKQQHIALDQLRETCRRDLLELEQRHEMEIKLLEETHRHQIRRLQMQARAIYERAAANTLLYRLEQKNAEDDVLRSSSIMEFLFGH